MNKKNKNHYWQPEFTDNAEIKGHEGEPDQPFSFFVWRKKKNLMKDWPKCTPLRYNEGDIEEPTFMD